MAMSPFFYRHTSPPSQISSTRSQMDSSEAEVDLNSQPTDECVTPDSTTKRKEVPTGSTSQPSSVKKTIVPRSGVWSHYTRSKETRNRCTCNYCEKTFSCVTTSGTSSLLRHLGVCGPYKTWLTGESQSVIGSPSSGVTNARVSEQVFREATNELMVLGQLPLSFVDSMAWKHFCYKVNLFKPHARMTATRDIVEMFVQRKAALKSWMSNNKQRVSLTTDIWSAQTTGASYMVITAHFVDTNWELKKIILGFKHVTDHKGQTISRILLECLAEWGIDKLFNITVDNATANTSALRKFHGEFSAVNADALVLDGSYMHVRCSAHIINLIANEGLTDLGDSVAAIRHGIQYVRSSANRLKSFEMKVDLGNMTRGSLPLDVKTRWNSTFLMLSRAIQFKLAFDKMESEDKLYNDYFLDLENGIKRIGPPSSADWAAVERLIHFLVIFYNSTLTVSESTTVNSYKCYGVIVTIESNLREMACSGGSEFKDRANEMLGKLHKYWDGLKNINKMLIVAAVFDPRKKLNYCKLCFETLYGKDSVESKEMYESVYCLLSSLYREYSSRHVKPVERSNSLQTQNLSTPEKVVDRMPFELSGLKYNNIDFVYKVLVDETGIADVRDELDIYLKEPVENPTVMVGTEYNVLNWWRINSIKFPVLAEIAKDLLAMQVSSVASESAFSTSGRVLDPYRSCLTHYMIEVLVCTEQWIKADIRMNESSVTTNEQMLAEVELLDSLEKLFRYPSSDA